METTTYTVSGMTCSHCASSVDAELRRIAGVRAVDVELDGGIVTITSDGPVAESAVAAAVEEAGYVLERSS
jgi:copper chaperone